MKGSADVSTDGRTDVRMENHVTIKIFWLKLSNFLSYGTPLTCSRGVFFSPLDGITVHGRITLP